MLNGVLSLSLRLSLRNESGFQFLKYLFQDVGHFPEKCERRLQGINLREAGSKSVFQTNFKSVGREAES